MDCSGKDNCECDRCDQDDYSSDDSTSVVSGKYRPGTILKQLPHGAVPCGDFMRTYNQPVPQPVPFGYSQTVRPITMLVPLYPVDNLVGLDSGSNGKISISFLYSAGLVVFSWEPFRCQLSAPGINRISLSSAPPHLPIYNIAQPISVEYNGIGQLGSLEINFKDPIEQIRFLPNISVQRAPKKGDVITIHGGSTTFIAKQIF